MTALQRHIATLLGLAVLSLLAMGSEKRTTAPTDAAAAVAAPAVDAGPPAAAVEVPDPKTDYTFLEDAKLDGNKAYGKTLLLHVWRGSAEPSKVTLYQCRGKGRRDKSLAMNYVLASYTDAQRSLVRAIPAAIPYLAGSAPDTGPRAVLEITGKGSDDALTVEIVQMLDVEPAEVRPLPAGVDYLSMDDVDMDGAKAAGRIARIRVYRGKEKSAKFTAFGCGRIGGTGFLNVTFTTEQRKDVRLLPEIVPTTTGGCLPIQVKLLTQDLAHTWNAQLLDVSKTDDWDALMTAP